MAKLLVICGPTGTGKTSLGITLAKKFNGEIISADSRQVYREMDIGTGKDVPENSKLQISDNHLGFYEIEGVRIWGYDLVDPKHEFNVSDYLKFAGKILTDIYKRKKLPIVVGGTGFYIKAITDGIPTIDIPRNEELREKLSNKSAVELFDTLSVIDPIKAASLNLSDKQNPRRLVRAIEIAQYSLDHQPSMEHIHGIKQKDTMFIGLSANENYLEERIGKRVDKRIQNGFEQEVNNLLINGVDWSNQSMFSLGYRQWRDYYEGGVEKNIAIAEWKKEERKYAKRQMVWFKKDSRINWFDIATSDYIKKVENMIKIWHNNLADAKEN